MEIKILNNCLKNQIIVNNNELNKEQALVLLRQLIDNYIDKVDKEDNDITYDLQTMISNLACLTYSYSDYSSNHCSTCGYDETLEVYSDVKNE